MEYKLELVLAIEAGDLGAFRRLFDINDLASNEYDGSLLHSAATFGTVEIVRFLVENGAEIDRPGGTYKAPALTYAAEEGNIEIVRYLVEAGSILDVTQPLRSPLLRAAAEGEVEVVEYLLTTGIDPHATYLLPTGQLINAYFKADSCGDKKTIELLEKHGCRMPIVGEDIPIWEPAPEQMLNRSPQFHRYEQIVRYMESLFGPVDESGMQELLPVVDGMSVGINVIQPNEEHPYFVVFTNGMSDIPMTVPQGQEGWRYAELLMHLPPDWLHPRDAGTAPQWQWPIHWLRKMAYHPHLNQTWLGRSASIVSSGDPPEPLGSNTEQSCLLMLPDVSKFVSPLQTTEGKQTHFFTIVPLFTEERDFELKHGMKEFFNRFSEHGVSLVVDVDRPNFALA